MPITPTEHREDIRELHVKINQANEKLSYITGQLDTKLPLLATKADVKIAISEHENDCKHKPSKTHRPPADWAKLFGGVTLALGALTAAVYALVDALAR